MAIAEKTGELSFQPDKTDITEARIYTHEELQAVLGADYRDRIRAYLEATRKIPKDHPLDWLHHGDDRYVHPGSSANYLIDQYVNNREDLLMVSVLPPGKETSPNHSHPEKTDENPYSVVESYGCISGKFNLHADGLVILMREESQEQQIFPGVEHRVSTPNDSWAVISIYMRNAGHYDRSQLHVRKP